jgi:menaquinol-cytochrome c reductase iron-sulfur subunit
MDHASEANTVCKVCETCTASEPMAVTRRTFLASLIGATGACIGAVLALPIVRYVLYPIQASAAGGKWSNVGDASEFAASRTPVRKTIELTQRDGWREVTSAHSVYVSRAEDGQLKVLSATCPHLGCSVAWKAAQDKFVCPCHGGEFNANGDHLFGPPPRGMDQLPIQIKDGKLLVQFQHFRSNAPTQEALS